MYQFRNVSCYIILNWTRIDKQYSSCPVPMSFWLLKPHISHRHALTHFATCWLATLLSQVFCNPLSNNGIGLHTMCICITPRFMVLKSGNKWSHIISLCQKSPIFVHDFSIYLYQCILFLFYIIAYNLIFNLCTVLSVYDCVLWRLVVALETVIDMMIDNPVKLWIILFVTPIRSCPTCMLSHVLISFCLNNASLLYW